MNATEETINSIKQMERTLEDQIQDQPYFTENFKVVKKLLLTS